MLAQYKSLFTFSGPVLAASAASVNDNAAVNASVDMHEGKASYYDPNGATGACGQKLSSTDLFVSVALNLYDHARCGANVTIHYNDNQVQATVQDMCPACDDNGLSMSAAVFQQLASLDEKQIDVQWEFA
ncbi:hypothetical protein BD626DRAFT_501954 [Schizophyllum amplum]|uniref:RlpA-like double-psi beta-barrel-protein domain-containing protein-containing protein n=1 Tax=Schizophyllum amplum TaxID=97359 RepID=A0A550C905_9AGAR|nr:hypothetical protein BD626DRAFT_501954 [Auriculariopsis ampla]